MIQFQSSKQKIAGLFLSLLLSGVTLQAQKIQRVQPKWWFGESVAANINKYNGTTQMLNSSTTVPAAFHKGQSVKPYISLLMEYRPNKVVGLMLNVAYDNRGGTFDQVIAPCNCPADLKTNISYVTIEPSLRIAPFSSALYFFIGPTISINTNKDFVYTQEKQTDVRGDLSDIRKMVLSAQAGAGIDIPLSKKTNSHQVTLSPFASFQTNLGNSPRTIESWTVYTIRAGIALKFGSVKAISTVKPIPEQIITVVKVTEKQVQFSVRAPKVVPLNRQIKESFPLRNSVFFDQGSTDVPARYVLLNRADAAAFRESQLQDLQPDNLNNGRSARQLAVYYNILNISGDRLRSNPASTIELSGASDKNPLEGKLMAENVKNYLVTVFEIDASRISTEGRSKPVIASEKEGGTRELELLREGDRRVDIVSTSPAMLTEVGGATTTFLKPVKIIAYQEDPLDSHVLFNADGATEQLKSWAVEVKDENGVIQYYGPYTSDRASVSGKTILGNAKQGNYKLTMIGQTNTGEVIRKESTVSLSKVETPKQEGLRYSILFDFDRSATIASYEKFLTDEVTPLVPDYGTVIIHGHTDIIGEEKYNLSLSQQRAESAKQILNKALSALGKKGVKFETYGFGADTNDAPFGNKYPEERFYNRTVIIDIIPR